MKSGNFPSNIASYLKHIALGLWFLGVTSIYPAAIIYDVHKHTKVIEDCYNSQPCKIQRYGPVVSVYYNGRWIFDYNKDGLPDEVHNFFDKLSMTEADIEVFKAALSLENMSPDLEQVSLETVLQLTSSDKQKNNDLFQKVQVILNRLP